MAQLTDQLAKVAADRLEPGEVIMAGARCVPVGATSRRALTFGLAGALGGTVHTKLGAPADHALHGESLPHDLALGLTERRILVFAVSTLTGRATKVIRSVPLAHVVGVDNEESRSLGRKMPRLRLRFTDGSTLALEAPGQVPAARGFSQALTQMVSGRSLAEASDSLVDGEESSHA